MHSKLLRRTKWGIERAICDSKRTALLDGIWFLGRRLFIASDSNTWSGGSIHPQKTFSCFSDRPKACMAGIDDLISFIIPCIKKHLWASFVLFGKHSGHANFQFLSSLFIHISLSFWIDCFCLWSPSLMLLNYYTMHAVDIDFAVVSTC